MRIYSNILPQSTQHTIQPWQTPQNVTEKPRLMDLRMGHLGISETLKVVRQVTSEMTKLSFVAGKSGSMKDFSYMFTNNLELSVKISCCKFPESYFLVDEWEKNKESLLSFIEEVHVGLKGLVSLEGNSLHQGAEILVWNPDGSKRGKNVLTSEFGEYWRLLRPGPPGNNTYTVQVI